MTNRKKKIALLMIFAFMAIAAAFACLAVNVSARANPKWGEVSVEEEYAYGSTFELPSRQLIVGGKRAEVSVVLRFPSGAETKEKFVKLTEAGVYTLRFIAISGGEGYLDEKEFKVVAPYAVVGEKSSVKYNETSVKPSSGALYVRLAAGEELRFSEPIDLKSLTSDVNLIEFMAVPDILGNQDFEKITIKLTDARDSSVYTETICYAYGGVANGCRAYVLSRANGQTPKGYFYNGTTASLQKNISGTSTAHYFNGYKNEYTGVQQFSSIRLAFDAVENRIYTNGRLTVDLDSPDCFPEKLWSGFTGDKAFLSITCDSYVSSTANFEIYSICGLNLSKTEYEDVTAPVITVDGENEKTPYAEVGKTYRIPSAYAFDDICGGVEVSRSVYYNYNSENPLLIAEENGRFKTDYAGSYAIVYSAKDFSGNASEKIIWVSCLKDAPDPQITLVKEECKDSATVGEKVVLAGYTVGSGSGALSVRTAYEYQGKSYALENKYFVPETAGDYKIVYTVTDEIGQSVTADYTIKVSYSDKPVFTGDAVLPSAFISGGKYIVPSFVAKKYSEGVAADVATVCEITDESGVKNYNAGEEFIPQISGKTGKITLKFKAGETEKIYEVPCVNVWNTVGNRKRIDFASYFYSENGVTAEKTENGVLLGVVDGGETEFINYLLAEKFVFSLRGLGSGGEFGTVILTLTDSVNKEESVSVIIGETRGKTTMTVSGNSVSPDFSFDGSKSLEISYADGAFFASGLSVSATYTDEGKPFKGFSSHKISLKMRFEKTGESSVYVERLCNQSFTGTVTRDVTAPEYYIRKDAGGVIEVGNYTLNAAYASDVLDPNVVFKVSVTDENGEFIKSIDGIELKDADPAKDYVVRFDKIGSYMVRYVVADTFNSSPNETVYSYSLTVEDKESPKIAINGEFKTTVKKGDVYVLPEFSVTDNCSASENIRIMKYVSDPSGRFVEIPANSNSFRVDYKGEYELRIMAVDEAGNVAYLCVKITAED